MTTSDVELEPAQDAEIDAAAEQARVVEKRRKRWGCLLYAGLAVLVPVLILFCTYLWFHLADRRLAEEALARARAAGDRGPRAPAGGSALPAGLLPTALR